MPQQDSPSYALITAVRNEEEHIEKTLNSVVSQTLLPTKWVIVSDGSTDRTEEIVTAFAEKNPFIELVRVEQRRERDFASKVYAINLGCQHLNDCEYDYLGNLDGDISFDHSYYENILSRLSEDRQLGIAGGYIYESQNGQFRSLPYNDPSFVAGAVQVFRRECYEAVNGYLPLRWGGEDTIAQTSARMHGWKVLSFSDLIVKHHRPMGIGGSRSLLSFRFKEGIRDYSLGYDPLYFMFKTIKRILEKPYLLGSLFRLTGYFLAAIRGYGKDVPPQVVSFIRNEQSGKIRRLLHLGA